MPSRLGHGLYDRLKNIIRCIYITIKSDQDQRTHAISIIKTSGQVTSIL